jgi:hypothetical protein
LDWGGESGERRAELLGLGWAIGERNSFDSGGAIGERNSFEPQDGEGGGAGRSLSVAKRIARRKNRFGLPVLLFPCTVDILISHFVAILG